MQKYSIKVVIGILTVMLTISTGIVFAQSGKDGQTPVQEGTFQTYNATSGARMNAFMYGTLSDRTGESPSSRATV